MANGTNDDDDPRVPSRKTRMKLPYETDYDDIKDSKVRGFLLRGGFSVDMPDDWKLFAQCTDLLRDLVSAKDEDIALKMFLKRRFESDRSMRRGRTRVILWFIGLVAATIITSFLTSGLHPWLTQFFH